MTLPATDQYMLVARPIADIKAHIAEAKAEVDREISKNVIARRKYNDAIAYAVAELKILDETSAYRIGWNAAIEMAINVIRSTRQ